MQLVRGRGWRASKKMMKTAVVVTTVVVTCPIRTIFVFTITAANASMCGKASSGNVHVHLLLT